EDVLVRAARNSSPRIRRASLRPVKKVLRVHGDLHDVLAGAHQNLVNFGRTDGPNMVNRSRLVWPVEKLWGAVSVSVERLILEIIIRIETRSEPLFFGDIHVHRAHIFALVERM